MGPLNIDMYLPSFPGIASDLDTTATLVQTSLTACLLGLAIGQLIFGPLSDSLGRKRPLLVALPLFAGASLLCALAPNISVLIGARFLQGFTASAGVVISRRSEEHTSELQSRGHLVCRLLLEGTRSLSSPLSWSDLS